MTGIFFSIVGVIVLNGLLQFGLLGTLIVGAIGVFGVLNLVHTTSIVLNCREKIFHSLHSLYHTRR